MKAFTKQELENLLVCIESDMDRINASPYSDSIKLPVMKTRTDLLNKVYAMYKDLSNLNA